MLDATDRFQDIREAVRDLCAGYPPEYFRRIDEERGYPEAFVDALTKAGWLAALIPQEYGGSGLGLTEASVIMEEINRAGGNSGGATARCTTWGRCSATARRSRNASSCRRSPPASRGSRRWASRSPPREPTRGG